MSVTLAIDPGTIRIGAAVITHTGDPIACWSMTVDGPDWPHKLIHGAARRAISTLLMVADGHAYTQGTDVTNVWVEDTRIGGGRNSRQTTWAQGGVAALLIDGCGRRWPHASFTLITPSEWRPLIGVAGNAKGDKWAMVDRARALGWRVPETHPTRPDHDAADAALLATACCVAVGALEVPA